MYYETYKKLCELKGVRSSEVSRKTGINDFEKSDVQTIETDAHKKDATQTPQKR